MIHVFISGGTHPRRGGGDSKNHTGAASARPCILQVKYDPVTLTARDNARYQVCLKHREFIADYLSVIGCELVHDPQDHLFRITGDGAAIEKMSLTTTKLLLLLKLIYRDKIMGEGLHATVTTLAEIREYGRNTGLLPGKLNAQDWQAALNLMKTHQMIPSCRARF